MPNLWRTRQVRIGASFLFFWAAVIGMYIARVIGLDAGAYEYKKALELDPNDATAHQWYDGYCIHRWQGAGGP